MFRYTFLEKEPSIQFRLDYLSLKQMNKKAVYPLGLA